MPRYLSPGVYVEEVSGGARPIEGVGTSTACFLGRLPNGEGTIGVPSLVTSFGDFVQAFGQNTNMVLEPFAASVRGFFDNGGSRVYILRLRDDATSVTSQDLTATKDLSSISLIACPGMTDAASHEALISHCETRGDRFAVLDLPPDQSNVNDMRKLTALGGSRPRDTDGGVAAVYGPWLDVALAHGPPTLRVAPSGHICGAFARNDSLRGVHRAPANLTLRGVIGLAQDFTSAETRLLSGAHINAIRIIRGRGIKVWGARTLSGAGSDYKYVSVRRLSTFINESISDGIRWSVFEPNKRALWRSIRRDISTFLNGLWRQGALRGSRPEDAFFVKCGEDTMSQDDVAQGRLIVQIGFAPIKPAEFIVVKISQLVGQTP